DRGFHTKLQDGPHPGLLLALRKSWYFGRSRFATSPVPLRRRHRSLAIAGHGWSQAICRDKTIIESLYIPLSCPSCYPVKKRIIGSPGSSSSKRRWRIHGNHVLDDS